MYRIVDTQGYELESGLSGWQVERIAQEYANKRRQSVFIGFGDHPADEEIKSQFILTNR